MILRVGTILLSTFCAFQISGGICYILAGNSAQRIAGILSIAYAAINILMLFVLPWYFKG